MCVHMYIRIIDLNMCVRTSCCYPECITDLNTSCCHPECIADLHGCYPTLDYYLLYNLVSEYLKKSCGENVPTSTPSVIRNPVNSEDKNEPVYIFNNLATSSRRQGTRSCSDGQRCAVVCVYVCTVHMYVHTYVCACVRRCVGVSVSFCVCGCADSLSHTQREKDRRTSDRWVRICTVCACGCGYVRTYACWCVSFIHTYFP